MNSIQKMYKSSPSSKDLREQGNKIYTSLTQNIAPCIRESRLIETLKLYQMAINSALNHDDQSSANKNHATASFELFK